MKGLVIRNTHVQYESPVTSGLKVMAKVKVFVHAIDVDADADGRAMTLAPRTYLSRLAKNRSLIGLVHHDNYLFSHVNLHFVDDVNIFFVTTVNALLLTSFYSPRDVILSSKNDCGTVPSAEHHHFIILAWLTNNFQRIIM